MVPALWLLPLALSASAVGPLVIATRRVDDELHGLRRSISALADVRAAAVAVGDESAAVRRTLENLTGG